MTSGIHLGFLYVAIQPALYIKQKGYKLLFLSMMGKIKCSNASDCSDNWKLDINS